VRKILERYGYRVLVAETPRAALDLARDYSDRIDLLMSDVVLPEMNGRSLSQQIVANRPEIRVVFMSGYTDNAIVHHGVLDPGTPFLQKPFTPDALARKVRAVLNLSC
jgi:two-component system, cell cycle sensor histidine kinase and response regulator CckA